jgi:hypothetical protein
VTNKDSATDMARRRFFRNTLALGVAAAGARIIGAEENRSAKNTGAPRINSVIRRDDTIVRTRGHGDIFPLTWLPDDTQFSSFSDGYGWSKSPKIGQYNSRAIIVSGGPQRASFRDVSGYPELKPPWGVLERSNSRAITRLAL